MRDEAAVAELRSKNKGTVNCKTGCFDNINSAAIISIIYCFAYTADDDS